VCNLLTCMASYTHILTSPTRHAFGRARNDQTGRPREPLSRQRLRFFGRYGVTQSNHVVCHAVPDSSTPQLGVALIVLGIILILVGYLLPVPPLIATIGWILLVVGVILLILGQVGRPVGGRRYWY
jgi:hypothetical protein